ncbi:hypothetical protein CDN99_21620 [Roseateles aquatilis]|uniref:Cytochrome b561 bacterial/Ni-hydrogenase domain-containing protein n=1 Tax=Roseateles aquatilis TaxID=431061 RepID=A0A246IZP1_9BURK|nr:cytochrome b/b6 domain-containing protein [Roseateles aquatilis]OWQ85682.1 hypothetical protein CDN99_21620 [Roseateles aquatilis]
MPGTAPRRAAIPVWDPLVRVLHVSLAASVIAAWVTGHWFHPLHHALGYIAAAIVAARALWGFAGSPHARFAAFVRGPAATWRYARLLIGGREPHHLGHNPLGGWMIVALLGTVALTSFTGFLYTTDLFWGYGWLEATHAALAWLLATLVAGHLLGVVVMSLREQQNLALAMVTGKKRADRASPEARQR